MNWIRIIIWMSLSTTILGLGHFYIWRRMVHDTELPTGWKRIAAGGIILLLLSQPAIFAASRNLPREVIGPWAFGAFVWMGLLSSLFTLLLVTDVVRWGVGLWRKAQRKRSRNPAEAPAHPERRQALRRMVAGGVAVGGGALTTGGVATALGDFTLKRLDVELGKLPASLDGFRIVQLTDIHVGPTIGREFIQRMVAVANAQRPDLVAITGDLVDGSVEHLSKHTQHLRYLSSPHGTYFVTGNHEYYSGAEEWKHELERLGITVLSNRHVSIERAGEAFDLAGVTDHRAGSYGDAPDFEAALRGRDPQRELVLLAHQPAAVFEAKRAGVGLQLSGHTHGGQFWPWSWVAHLVHPVVSGLARFGDTQIYVSSGTGYWGPPIRVGTEAEITVVTLRSAERFAVAST